LEEDGERRRVSCGTLVPFRRPHRPATLADVTKRRMFALEGMTLNGYALYVAHKFIANA
jgi:hypothetical protein